MRRYAVPIALVVMLLAASSAPATSNLAIATHLRLSNQFPAFHGHVRAVSNFCERGRIVRLYKVRNHRPDRFLGSDVTSHRGRWSVLRPNAGSGEYYAKTPIKPTPGNEFCARDESNHVVID